MAFFDFLTGGGKTAKQQSVQGLGSGQIQNNMINNGFGAQYQPNNQQFEQAGQMANLGASYVPDAAQVGMSQFGGAGLGLVNPNYAQSASPQQVSASTVDPTQMQAAQAQSHAANQYLRQANQASGMLGAAAAGNAPSVAAIQQQQGLQQAQANALSMANSARGGADQRAAAQRFGQTQQAQMGQQAVNNAAALRAGEMATARGQFGDFTAGMQGQLMNQAMGNAQLQQQAGLANQSASMQAQLANQGAGLQAQGMNQAAGLQNNQFNAGMGMQAMQSNQAAQLQAGMLNAQLAQQNQLQNKNRELEAAGLLGQIGMQGNQIGLQAQSMQNQAELGMGTLGLQTQQLQEKQANDIALAAQGKAGTTMQGIGGLVQGVAGLGSML